MVEPTTEGRPAHVSLREALKVWAYVALNSFGGPAGQIAVMHRVIVDTRHWISDRRFLHALNYCMLLPGPEAQQLSVYIGWLMHGHLGGLLAGSLFVLPGFVAILVLSVLYATYQGTTFVDALFYGLAPAVLAIVAAAVLRVGRRSLTDRTLVLIAAASFVAIFFLEVPFPVVIAAAALIGLVRSAEGHGATARTPEGHETAILADDAETGRRPSLRRALAILALGVVLWFGPVLLLT